MRATRQLAWVSVLAGVLLVGALGALGTITPAAGAAALTAPQPPCPAGQPTGRPPGTPPPGKAPTGRPSSYPLGQCQLLLSSGVVPPSASVFVEGTGFAPGAAVVIRLQPVGVFLADVSASLQGGFDVPVRIPATTSPGSYEVTATGAGADGGTIELTAWLTVTGHSGSAPSPGGSSSTGGSSAGGTVGAGSSPSPSGGRPSSSGGAANGRGGSSAAATGGRGDLAFPPAASGAAPSAGMTTGPATTILLVGLALVLGGAGAVLWSRRRRHLGVS